jgi:hypothetical protein
MDNSDIIFFQKKKKVSKILIKTPIKGYLLTNKTTNQAELFAPNLLIVRDNEQG